MKKTILIAAFTAAFFATANAQRQSDNNDRARENRKEYDSRSARVGNDRNDNRDYENRNRNDNDRNGNDKNRRDYDNNKNRGNARVEVYSRGYGYGNRNYGNNGYRYGRDDRYNHAWDHAYAPMNWNRDTQLRISDGQRRGLITDFESRRLFRELDRVVQREQDYGRNGYFSQRERENLIDDIRDLNQEISRQMHDDDFYKRNSWFFRNGY